MSQPGLMRRSSTGRHAREVPASPTPRGGAVAVALALAAVVAVVTVAFSGPDPPAPTTSPPAAPATPPSVTPTAFPTAATPPTEAPDQSDRWRSVLRQLDRKRAAAFAQDRPGLLAKVYLPGSAVLAEDQATMAAYRSRGLRVVGLRMRLLRFHVLNASPARVVLEVVDQLAPATAVDQSARIVDLRRDRPTRHRIVLRRTPAGWRIAAIQSAVRQGHR